MHLRILTPADAQAEFKLKHWLAACAMDPHPHSQEFAKEATILWSMYGAHFALRWMTVQSACWMMLASGMWRDDDGFHDTFS